MATGNGLATYGEMVAARRRVRILSELENIPLSFFTVGECRILLRLFSKEYDCPPSEIDFFEKKVAEFKKFHSILCKSCENSNEQPKVKDE